MARNGGRGGARYNSGGELLTGRKIGSKANKTRKTSTITIWPGCWVALDKIGPSRGKAVEKLLKKADDIIKLEKYLQSRKTEYEELLDKTCDSGFSGKLAGIEISLIKLKGII